MATSTGATPAYLLAPEVSALLWYMPDQRHHMLFATMWNTGSRIGEARTLTPESFDLDGLRPFVRVLSEKVRARRGRPPKDEVRLVPPDGWQFCASDGKLDGHHPPRRRSRYGRSRMRQCATG
ncbi:site-specific recombinase, phage integrase family [Klebsiella pneumoniae]|uniref:Site-specific recombinase, phage integrase family n=1 Tax=Klebsiella pneumoniae TaxID=573 RepID=A0A2X3E5T7_KLEPN|nr:site-specific recombinase, phage integrase family [Klebsiella pneumoniae]